MINESVEIASLNIDAQVLLEKAASGELPELLADVLKDKTEEERAAFLESLYDDLKTAVDQYKEILDGEEVKLDEAEDLDNGLQNKYQRECDELEALIDQLQDSDLKIQLSDSVEEINQLYIESDQDLNVSTSSYDDRSEVNLTFTGGTSYVMSEVEDDPLTDLTGDGLINYHDEEQRHNDAMANRFDEGVNQDVFLKLASDEIVTSVLEIDGRIQITVTGPDKTVKFNLTGVKEGVHLYFDTDNPNFMSSTVMDSMSADLQKQCFVGDDINNIFENRNQPTDEEKLAYVDGYDTLVTDESIAAMANAYAEGSDAAAIAALAKRELQKIFISLNSDDIITANELWSEIVNADLAGLDDQMLSDVLMTMVMVLSKNQQYFQLFLGGTVPTIVETAFLNDGTLNTSEKAVSMFMELQSGGAGLYGGAGFWTTNQSASGNPDDPGYVSGGSGYVWGLDQSDQSLLINHADWSDVDSTQAALLQYQTAVAESGWATDDGNAQVYYDGLEEHEEIVSQGYSATVTQEYLDAYNKAYSYTDDASFIDDADDWGEDGINVDRYIEEVQLGLAAAYGGLASSDGGAGYSIDYQGQPFGVGSDISIMAANIIGYLGSLPEDHDGDVAAGLIYVLNKACPELVKSLCAIEGFASTILNWMNGENNPTDKIDDAKKIINDCIDDIAS